MSKKKVDLIQQRSALRATNQLTEALSRSKDTAAVSPEILEAFYNQVGGAAGYGQMLAADFGKSRGVGLSNSEEETFEYNAGTVARWHDIILRFQNKVDDRNVTDISAIGQDELEAIVKQVALEMLLGDPDLQAKVLVMAVKQNNAVLQEMADALDMVVLPKDEVEEIEVEDEDELEYESDTDG